MTRSIWKTPAGAQAVRARYRQFLAYWPQPAEQRTIPTRHGETFVVVSGPPEAPPVVLLHGSASNSVSWLGDARLLAQHFRLYAVDVIGEPGLSSETRPALASGAYEAWLSDVLAGLGLTKAALVGLSLGGWLATDYATRRPEQVSALVLLVPGGIGKHKNVLLWAGPLLLLGPWGRKQVMKRLGRAQPEGEVPPAVKAFGDFMAMIFKEFRPRSERLPRFSDADLARLTMPVMCVLGGRDAFVDSAGTRRRLAASVPHAKIAFLPEAGHFLPPQTGAVDAFLAEALA
jgi:pimeloyl-ACP methyl ester carboxylesterase